MGVDVVNRVRDVRQRHFHAARRAFARGLDHVEAVGGGAVAGELRVDLRVPLQRVFILLQDDDTAAAGDDEPVPVLIERPGRMRRVVVIL